ncbi:MAG: DNA polymerase [Verrucomicrobia bacterium]|nr:DNA polymerase [Verrucomicrobiota bacterium]
MCLRTLFLDFNSYFASVEQMDRPELRGRPVAVAPLKAETTCCIAASQEAKARGIRTGTQIAEARRLCPGLEVIEARPQLYVETHNQLVKIIGAILPVEAVVSIDEMHCKLWGEWTQPEQAPWIARELKRAIAEQVSPVLTCSIGLAPNPFLAKTASDMQKPDGLMMICPEDLPRCLYRLELRDLCGIGGNMEARLQQRGITTVEQLCAASKETLRAVWGGVGGEYFYRHLRGEETVHLPTVHRTVGHSHVLPPELRNEASARAVLHRLTQKAAMRLRAMKHVAGGMALYVRGYESARDRPNWSDDVRFAHTQDTIELLHALDLLWRRRAAAPAHTRPTPPLAVGVTLLHLAALTNATPSLFGREERRRRHAMLRAVDAINRRYGINAVHFGGATSALAYAPMRIAFNHIPDVDFEHNGPAPDAV